MEGALAVKREGMTCIGFSLIFLLIPLKREGEGGRLYTKVRSLVTHPSAPLGAASRQEKHRHWNPPVKKTSMTLSKA
jgi:hypothetical protein